jgi:putative colanic acid biosynthesis acetyltransferase WcaF
MNQTDLSSYENKPFHPGGNKFTRTLWYYVNSITFKTGLFPISVMKVFLLRIFGANIGKNVTIKPCVNIKYPWNLTVGNNTWIGEGVWIDNLVMITIGSNISISQGAALLTGSHNYKNTTFDLITGSILLEDGSWIGAFSVVNQGITVASHAVLTTGSIATKNMEAYCIYQGNPAVKIRHRIVN